MMEPITSITPFQGKTFSFEEVRDMLEAVCLASGVLTRDGNAWNVKLLGDVPTWGIDLNATYGSVDEAVNALFPYFQAQHTQINQRAA